MFLLYGQDIDEMDKKELRENLINAYSTIEHLQEQINSLELKSITQPKKKFLGIFNF